MGWSSKTPTQPGWYWLQIRGTILEHIDESRYVFMALVPANPKDKSKVLGTVILLGESDSRTVWSLKDMPEKRSWLRIEKPE